MTVKRIHVTSEFHSRVKRFDEILSVYVTVLVYFTTITWYVVQVRVRTNYSNVLYPFSE